MLFSWCDVSQNYNLMISWNVLQRTLTNDIMRTSILQCGSESAGVVWSTKACKVAIIWTYDVWFDPKKKPSKKDSRVELWHLSHYPSISKQDIHQSSFWRSSTTVVQVIANHLTFARSAARTSRECLLKVMLVVERSKVCCSEKTIINRPSSR